MSLIERLDLWRLSLPRICMWCRWGNPVLFGRERFLETYACGRHSVSGLKSSKLTAPPWHDPGGGKGDQRTYSPMMGADETCEAFEPIKITDQKTKLLDAFGYLGSDE